MIRWISFKNATILTRVCAVFRIQIGNVDWKCWLAKLTGNVDWQGQMSSQDWSKDRRILNYYYLIKIPNHVLPMKNPKSNQVISGSMILENMTNQLTWCNIINITFTDQISNSFILKKSNITTKLWKSVKWGYSKLCCHITFLIKKSDSLYDNTN